MNNKRSDAVLSETDDILSDAGQRLKGLLEGLAKSIRPFPSFLGMITVQAVELEPDLAPGRDLGCVVVSPEGEICRLDIAEIAGIAGLTETDRVEEFQPLDLSALEYLSFAKAAIEVLTDELQRRGG